MKPYNPFRDLTKFELCLWLISVITVSLCYISLPKADYLTLIASLVGVTALIFVAKGYLIGQILSVIFAIFYGIISYYFKYYGEMITYLLMTAPIAVSSIITWARHPYKKTKEVTACRMTKKQTAVMFILASAVTFVFYFILKALGTASLMLSTVSITTSFLAVYMTNRRSPYYAVGYMANDVVLIALWIIASVKDPAYFPMIICFVMFLINDLYGFFNWQRMMKRQEE